MKYGLADKDIEAILQVLKGFDEVDEAILYGSRAKGNFKPASDIDLTLKGAKLNLSIVNKISWMLDDLLLPYTFDLSIFTQIQNEDLTQHIERVGVRFYEKSV